MTDPYNRIASSSDSLEDLQNLERELRRRLRPSETTGQLRDTLNSPSTEFVDYVPTPVSSTSTLPTDRVSILNPDGSMDLNRFTEAMLLNSSAMSTLLGQSLNKSTNYNKLKEKRLLEDPPLLKSTATYQDFVHWVDQILIHFQRHPDFRTDFLKSVKPVCSTAQSQGRLDEVYAFIQDKLYVSTQSNQKIRQLISQFTLSSQVYLAWKKIMDYFLPDTESAKQEREDKFNELQQKENETNTEFCQRVQFEMQILKFVNQDISEARLRLRISKGLKNKWHREMAQLQDNLNLDAWIEYVHVLETINSSKSDVISEKSKNSDQYSKDFSSMMEKMEEQNQKLNQFQLNYLADDAKRTFSKKTKGHQQVPRL